MTLDLDLDWWKNLVGRVATSVSPGELRGDPIFETGHLVWVMAQSAVVLSMKGQYVTVIRLVDYARYQSRAGRVEGCRAETGYPLFSRGASTVYEHRVSTAQVWLFVFGRTMSGGSPLAFMAGLKYYA